MDECFLPTFLPTFAAAAGGQEEEEKERRNIHPLSLCGGATVHGPWLCCTACLRSLICDGGILNMCHMHWYRCIVWYIPTQNVLVIIPCAMRTLN